MVTISHWTPKSHQVTNKNKGTLLEGNVTILPIEEKARMNLKPLVLSVDSHDGFFLHDPCCAKR